MKKQLFAYCMIIALAFSACGTKVQTPEPTQRAESSVNGEEGPKAEDPTAPQGEEVAEGQEAAGSADGSAPVTSAAKELWERSLRYDIYLSDANITLDYNGSPVRNEDIRVDVKRDILTNEISYYVESYKVYEKVGEWEYETHMMSRLYDAAGEMLIDWTETEYTDAVGDWIVSREFVQSMEYMDGNMPEGVLLNARTGETLENVAYLEPVGNHVLTRLNYQSFGTLLDATGAVVRDVSNLPTGDAPEKLYQVYRNYLYVSEGDYDNGFKVTFYSEEGEPMGMIPLVHDNYIYSISTIAPFVTVDNTVYDPSQGSDSVLEPVYESRALQYYDSEIYIDAAGGTDDGGLCIYDTKTGKALSGAYHMIYNVNGDYTADPDPAECFYAVDGEDIIRLDRMGNETARQTIPGLCGVMVHIDEIEVNTNDWTSMVVLDKDLNVQVPERNYSYVYGIYDSTDGYNETNSTGLKVGRYTFGEYNMRGDIIDSTGRVIMSGISENSSWKAGRMAVKRGQTIGLIDAEGNWLAKIPVHELINAD